MVNQAILDMFLDRLVHPKKVMFIDNTCGTLKGGHGCFAGRSVISTLRRGGACCR